MPNRLKVLIVDDEQLARIDLQYMLKKLPEVESVSECTNATEALALLHEDVFDALFLDIEMPGLNGLKAVKIINKLQNPPLIVFVTAYDEHAAKAFELNAVDYLVKPYSEKRLAQAIAKIQKAQSNMGKQPEPERSKSGTINLKQEEPTNEAHFKKIPVEKGDGVLLINLSDVRYIVAYNDRVFVNTMNEQYLCRFSLAELEQRLNTQGFVRIHRSYIANLQHILELQPYFNGTYNLIIDDKKHTILPVSRSRVKLLRSLIGV
ncbi:MAG: response regulator transcription factor [Chloroflexi bacterium]|uniref:LytTR family DNA-binding domain-containing protein n=1 Tax=Candidatus Chlorohelix allophototropha TaxID=3003348 RepID=A0A8T7M361_9CHLR|nr:response regulator transcription factor [Chloroflexota bacterium]WJW67267.1 LytTR family DNA-binding domain-containing protein [Chloroflexota bacterium L227-S17]